ncbi:3-oxoacyl-[acyl-carrier-protein] synthase II, chloroplastic-like [Primulina eburnea]|uniref:3-oxoacyl-[acyl-carrier-protein] synthase II, chloroplastic-like n=1 Tax=Primulina eburnea TaxID=1245227 RepID=UPI003C6C5EB3
MTFGHSQSRDGFVLGERDGVLLREELEHVKDFKTPFGSKCKKSGISMHVAAYVYFKRALPNSGVSKEDVNYVNANATSARSGDFEEYRALVHCFGKNREVP